MDFPVAVVDFVLCGVKQVPGRGGINPAISVKNYVGHLVRTFARHDVNHNGRYAFSVQGAINNILSRAGDMFRGRRR